MAVRLLPFRDAHRGEHINTCGTPSIDDEASQGACRLRLPGGSWGRTISMRDSRDGCVGFSRFLDLQQWHMCKAPFSVLWDWPTVPPEPGLSTAYGNGGAIPSRGSHRFLRQCPSLTTRADFL